jgi:transposase
MFIYRSRSGKAIRIFAYDCQGFWIATKRLSKGRCKWWQTGNEPAKTLRAHQTRRAFDHRHEHQHLAHRPSEA